MKTQDKALDIADERTREKNYGRVLRNRERKVAEFEGPASRRFVAGGLPPRRDYGPGELVGRVALIRPDEDILDGGSDFYIGETYANVDGVYVFGWRNPIARTFFRGREKHELCDVVGVVRALRHHNGQIVDLLDERVRPDAPANPFKKGGLSIPAPPSAPKLPIPRPAETIGRTATARPSGPTREPVIPARPAAPVTPNAAARKTSDELPPLRAESLLREQLRAPRTKSLTSVLSTLQSDQYELVTLPAMDNVIIEGQPGTGKTIVAAHRAAYVTADDIEPENAMDGTLLVVGPTPGYSKHVRDVISRLAADSDRIKVLSLPELSDFIIGASRAPATGATRTYQDAGWELVRFVRSAISKLKSAKGVKPSPREAYEFLRTRTELVTTDPEWAPYLRRLPEYKEAQKLRVHAPLIAFLHWELDKPAELGAVEHIIVDEAQDVTPLEWYLLDEINQADAWTILGDLNQRRSDHSLSSWSQVLEHIAIDPNTPIRQMKRGYRSTKPILEFANRLLPRNQRTIFALQEEGPEPTVTKVARHSLGATTVDEIERLIDQYPSGLVAAICRTPSSITAQLRARGWATDSAGSDMWTRGDKQVTVMEPDTARGLEFDGVVVVEPADFPRNFGRQGPLYTALTRANRELAVVHAEGLPEELRRR